MMTAAPPRTVPGLRDRSWGWLLRRCLLPAGDLLFGQGMIRRLHFLESAQWWEPERLHRERDRQLSLLIRTAYAEVPFYRELMDQARVKLDDIRRPEDLGKLPVVP